MKIAVLVLDQVFDTGLSTLLDTLALANSIAASENIDAARFDVSPHISRIDHCMA